MKSLYLLFIFTSFFSTVQSQTIIWEKTYGGQSTDRAINMVRNSANNFNVIGYTSSSNQDVVGQHGFSADVWLIEIDSIGTLLRQKCFGGSTRDEGYSIKNTFDDGFIITGFASSSDFDLLGAGNQANSNDFWILKIDSNWNIQMSLCLGTLDQDYGSSIIQTSDSGYLVCGTIANGSNDEIYVVKLSSQGAVQWTKTLGGSYQDFGRDAVQTRDGGYLILADGYSSDGDIPTNHMGHNYIFKLDSAGNLVWVDTYGGTSSEEAHKIMLLPDESFTVLSSTNSNDGDVTGHHTAADVWIFNADSSGNLNWQSCIGTYGMEIGCGFSITNDGGYIICASSLLGDGVIQNIGGQDYWIIKTDSSGQYQWSKIIGGSSNDIPTAIIETRPNEYLCTGSTGSDNFDVSFHHGGNNDFWAVKIAGPTISVEELQPSVNELSVQYDADQLVIQFGSSISEKFSVTATDITGKNLFTEQLVAKKGINQFLFSTELPQGIILITLHDVNGIYISKKLFIN